MATNGSYVGHTDLLNVVILDNPAKGIQYRLTISEFREVLYIGAREWYADFDGTFAPSSNGFTMPYTLHSASALYHALASLLSSAETLQEVQQQTPSLKKAEVLDTLSQRFAVPSDLLADLLLKADTQVSSTKITLEINLPEGSSWLKP